MIPVAAVLLAGGQSRRMGRDKALLPVADGRLLWQRQLDVLRELRPAELFISGPAREGFPLDTPLLADDAPGLGPLAGIAAGLAAARSPLLVVLAVDLPRMTAEYLRCLLGQCLATSPLGGVVPQAHDSSFEPLTAIYPHTALALANEHLRSADRSMQSFVRSLCEDRQMRTRAITASEAHLFANWNHPENAGDAR